MNKQDIKKNKLDLEYQKNIQLLNAIFIFLTTGLAGFVGSFIFLEDRTKLLVGTSISALILISGYFVYQRVNKRLEDILNQIGKL